MTAGTDASAYFAPLALLPDGLATDVRIVTEGDRFAQVDANSRPEGARRLPGITLPGLANAHSHAFHRALRGRTHDDGGTFWTWRERMYALAARLDPDGYRCLARAVYAEMASAGITTVAEFHYLHHAPDGTRYADPNAMAEALRVAADEAGVRLTLLDTCYLAGGLSDTGHLPLDEVQRRFADPSAEAWAQRVAALRPSAALRVGVAAHSVRAVPREDLSTVHAVATGRPLHVHLSEQPAENEVCQAYYGCSPTQLLDATGLLGETTTVVHATHVQPPDVTRLGTAGVTACFCPTTERDLADGIGPAGALLDAGARLSLGSDQHAVIDLFEEARGVELHERLRDGRRGRLRTEQLHAALFAHDSIGWPECGRIQAGARADLVAVRLDTPRTAGCDPAQFVFAAGAPDVDTVLRDGREIVTGGRHRLGDVGRLLDEAIRPLWQAIRVGGAR